jgi:hypothetical protein
MMSMKKIILLAFAAIVAVGFTSCQKTYICECTSISGNTEQKIKGTKNDAEDACEDREDQSNGVECELQ